MPPQTPEGVELHPFSSGEPGLSPTLKAGDVAVDIAPETITSSGAVTGSSVRKRDSFVDAKFYDAKSTNLPVYGKRLGDADVIEGPMEAEPQVTLCCAVLRCAVLCCAALCCGVLCWPVLCCAVLCRGWVCKRENAACTMKSSCLRFVTLRRLCRALICYVVLCQALSCCTTFHFSVICLPALHCVM